MLKPKNTLSLDQFFTEALRDAGPNLSSKEKRLLLSGMAFLHQAAQRSLNKNELHTIYRLIAYVAAEQHLDQASILSTLCAHFNVDALEGLQAAHYEQVLSYLTSFETQQSLN